MISSKEGWWMKRLVVVILVVGLAAAVLCLGATESLTNHSGKTASGVVLTFSESVRITSYDQAVFPNQDPTGRAETFTFSGGELQNGGRFKVTWSPSSAALIDEEWASAQDAQAPVEVLLDTPYTHDPSFMVGGLVCDYLATSNWGLFWKGTNPLEIMKANGFEWVRVWIRMESSAFLKATAPEEWDHLPWRSEYWASLEYATEILRQATSYGMRCSVILLLSDKPAHAGQQPLAEVWKGLKPDALLAAIEDYCYQTAAYLRDHGIAVEFYAIGNEIEWGVAGNRIGEQLPIPPGIDITQDMSFMESFWKKEAVLLQAAIRGVRRAAPEAEVVLHVDSLELNPQIARTFFQTVVAQGVDFDYAGLSLPCPFNDWRLASLSKSQWYGELDEIVRDIASLGKKVIICEGAYPSRPDGITGLPMPDYPYTSEGQGLWVRDALRFTRNHPSISGFFYFYPDWFPGMNPDPTTPVDVQSYGLFATDRGPKPAMAEFQVNLPPQ
jgi:arabinogalactan endo-1,4-beta-galactosidase